MTDRIVSQWSLDGQDCPSYGITNFAVALKRFSGPQAALVLRVCHRRLLVRNLVILGFSRFLQLAM